LSREIEKLLRPEMMSMAVLKLLSSQQHCATLMNASMVATRDFSSGAVTISVATQLLILFDAFAKSVIKPTGRLMFTNRSKAVILIQK
jgi:hypothetical protein